MFFEADHTASPVVIVRFVRAPLDREFAEYIGFLRSLPKQTHRFGLILDLRQSPRPTMSERRQIGEWSHDHGEQFRERSVGTAFVTDSAAQRFILSSIMLISKPMGESTVVANLAAAARYQIEILSGHSLDVPPALRRIADGSA